jgi:glycosyltransferase involved in cell wall biosynthesis
MNQTAFASDTSVSVIIPVYNGERFLGEALASLLRQTIRPNEIIIVDDGSTDGTPQIAAEFEQYARYFRQERQGPPAARNFGVAKATGEWISMLDSDDVWPDNSLELQLAPIKADESIQVVVGHALLWRDPNAGSTALPCELPTDPQLILNLGSALILKSLFEQLGPLDTNLLYCDDWDWFMRVRELGIRMHIHGGLVLYYRRHDGNLTNNRKLDQHFVVQMLKQSLDRRRAGGGLACTLPRLQDEKPKAKREERKF